MAKVIRREDESIETLLRRFKKAVNSDNIIGEYREREFYTPPALKRKKKSEAAQKRRKRLEKKKVHINNGYDY